MLQTTPGQQALRDFLSLGQDQPAYDSFLTRVPADSATVAEIGDIRVHERCDMAYLVIPHEVSASTATIWVGAIDERFDPGSNPPCL